MNGPHPDLDKCHSFVLYHLSEKQKRKGPASVSKPFITISRQAGAGGRKLAKALRGHLDKGHPLTEAQWTVFDRDLVKRSMQDHGLPERFAHYLPEGHVSEVSSLIGELVGLHPSIWELNQNVFETLVHLARLGGVIIVGRGAHIVTRNFENGFHIRLVGSLEKRAMLIADRNQISQDQAITLIRREDVARGKWVRENFAEDINDPANYDITINTDNFFVDALVAMVDCLFAKRFS